MRSVLKGVSQIFEVFERFTKRTKEKGNGIALG